MLDETESVSAGVVADWKELLIDVLKLTDEVKRYIDEVKRL